MRILTGDNTVYRQIDDVVAAMEGQSLTARKVGMTILKYSNRIACDYGRAVIARPSIITGDTIAVFQNGHARVSPDRRCSCGHGGL
jgi:hypothetical protein